MSLTSASEKAGSALDLLEAEDVELRRLFTNSGRIVARQLTSGPPTAMSRRRSSGTSPRGRRPWSM